MLPGDIKDIYSLYYKNRRRILPEHLQILMHQLRVGKAISADVRWIKRQNIKRQFRHVKSVHWNLNTTSMTLTVHNDIHRI